MAGDEETTYVDCGAPDGDDDGADCNFVACNGEGVAIAEGEVGGACMVEGGWGGMVTMGMKTMSEEDDPSYNKDSEA